MRSKNKRLLSSLFLLVVVTGVGLRLALAWRFQSRAWIDEVWVLLNPAYNLLTGVGYLNPQDWGGPSPRGIRSWVPPGLLFFYLKALSLLGIEKGTLVLPLVRTAFAALSACAILYYVTMLGRAFRLKAAPILPAFVLLFTPQLIHYGALHDLSVVGLPALLFAFALINGGNGTVSRRRFRSAAVLLSFSCVLRFQYVVFAFAYLAWLLYTRDRRRAGELAIIGVLVAALDAAINTYMFGRPIFPALNFFLGNAIYGMGNDAGTMPFGVGLEFLWRYITEPTFALVFMTLVFSLKRLPYVTLASAGFYAIHLILSHKEFRYFYAPAVLLAGLAAASLQAWAETHWARASTRVATSVFLVLFIGFGTWRGLFKTAWQDYETPSKLETLAGAQPDVKGLLVVGWGGGIYCGGQYSFHKPLPYHCGSSVGYFREQGAVASDFNYVVMPENEPVPCTQVVARHGGGALYHCTNPEIERLLRE